MQAWIISLFYNLRKIFKHYFFFKISATPVGLNIGSESFNYIDSHTYLYFHPDGNSFLQLAPVLISDEEYFSNIIMVDALKRHSWPLTDLKSEIHRILGWDVRRNIV
jgi:hypothetical protein